MLKKFNIRMLLLSLCIGVSIQTVNAGGGGSSCSASCYYEFKDCVVNNRGAFWRYDCHKISGECYSNCP